MGVIQVLLFAVATHLSLPDEDLLLVRKTALRAAQGKRSTKEAINCLSVSILPFTSEVGLKQATRAWSDPEPELLSRLRGLPYAVWAASRCDERLTYSFWLVLGPVVVRDAAHVRAFVLNQESWIETAYDLERRPSGGWRVTGSEDRRFKAGNHKRGAQSP